MKKQRTILIKLNILWRAACWCALVVGLTLACGAAMAELTPIILNEPSNMFSPYSESVTFSPDGKLLVTVGHDYDWVWEISSGKLLAKLDNQGLSLFRKVAFSPEGSLLATLSNEFDWKLNKCISCEALCLRRWFDYAQNNDSR